MIQFDGKALMLLYLCNQKVKLFINRCAYAMFCYAVDASLTHKCQSKADVTLRVLCVTRRLASKQDSVSQAKVEHVQNTLDQLKTYR